MKWFSPAVALLTLSGALLRLSAQSTQKPDGASSHLSHSPATSQLQGLPQPAHAFLQARCVGCHSAQVKSGRLDLQALQAKLDDPVNEAEWVYLFDRVQRGEMPPKKIPQPLAAERNAFLQSLGGYIRQHEIGQRAGSGRTVLRRLNRVEYENTIHDLLGIDTPLAELLPVDASSGGFDNVGSALRLSATQIESYLTAADRALDAAMNVGVRPQIKKQRFAYLDLPQIKEALARHHGMPDKDGNKYQQIYRALPDALVIFSNETFGGTLLRESRAEATGLYRIRLSAYGYQTRGRPTVVAKLMATNFARTRTVAAFDLPFDKPREVEITARLEEGELLYLSAAGCDIAADGTSVWAVGGEKFTGSGMAIQWLETEGPLLDSWPPPSLKRVYGDQLVRILDKPLPNGHGYEVAFTNPEVEVRKVVSGFARRAFRRPMTDADIAPYSQLAVQALKAGQTVESALRRAYKAILTSPEFLFLQETPGKLDDFALASRLSYFLWSSMPDDELLRIAATGKLHDPVTLHTQTERMLSSPRAHTFTHNFCGQWLNLRAINATTPDRQLYPEFDDLLQDAMVGETESFFEEMLRSDLSLSNIIDSDFTMLNRRLAEEYGIPGVIGEQFRKVRLPAGSHRGGVLTQASVLKVTANGTLSSPVVRGAWVLRRIVGRQLQPPPADAGSIQPDTRGATTIREQLVKHRRSETCAGCHKYMDPPGFALENYDVIGGWRSFYRSTQGQGEIARDPLTHRNLEYRQGKPVDASGELVDGRKFQDIDAFKKLLLGQKEAIAQNVVSNLVTYATGAEVTFADRAEVQAILRRAKPRDYGLRTLVHEIVRSSLFQNK